MAIAIYFSILKVQSGAASAVLDEIEAALDDVNVNKYAAYLQRLNEQHAVYRHHSPAGHHGAGGRAVWRDHAGGGSIQDFNFGGFGN